MALAVATLMFLRFRGAAIVLICWGTLNAAIPVAWSTWLARNIVDKPESGGGLMVAAIQLAIMLGAAAGGLLLDHISLTATWIGGSVLLLLASLVVGNGERLQDKKAGIAHN